MSDLVFYWCPGLKKWIIQYQKTQFYVGTMTSDLHNQLMIEPIHAQEVDRLKLRKVRDGSINQSCQVTLKLPYATGSLNFSYPAPVAFALPRLTNIQLVGISKAPPIESRFETVLCFGAFDLLHDLHRRLLKSALSISCRRLVIFVWGQSTKASTVMSDSVQDRISNVTSYLCQSAPGIEIRVERMTQKHKPELVSAIKKYGQMGSMALFGGADQFENYPEVLDICWDHHVAIRTVDRGQGLCSTDLRTVRVYQSLSAKYDLAISDQISNCNSPSLFTLWKANPQSLKQAQKYWSQSMYLGSNGGEIWKYEPDLEFDRKITEGIIPTTRSIVCLPGRTRCNLERGRKILKTIREMMRGQTQPLDYFLFSYTDNEHTTGYYTDHLKLHPKTYFSRDALRLTQVFLLPRISSEIRVNERGQIISKPSNRDDFEVIRSRLSDLTFWGRSRGAVITWEIENAFRYYLNQLGYHEEEIKLLAQQVVVCNISNLVDPTADRLFSTISVTGINDSKAKEYISTDYLALLGLQLTSPQFRSYPNCHVQSQSRTNLIVLAQIPDRILTYDDSQGKDGPFRKLVTVEDSKCHYTPLFLAPRYGTQSNYLSEWIHLTFFNLVNRHRYFTLEASCPSLYEITHRTECYPNCQI